jgi:hypothetical protein
MGIKRYTANADTTITNAYKANLNTRGTDANMGLADSLEVFHIYGQESSSSAENSRVLIDFPVTTTIASDRSAGTIPASGSVSWFLRVHNVAHPSTLPRNYNMTILAVSSSWDEGTGMDMEEYSDVGATSWLYRNDTPAAATGTITVTSNPSSGNFTVTVAGTTVTVTRGVSTTATATAIKTALNNDVTIGALVTATSLAAVVTITADTGGSAGNYAYSATNGNGTITAAGSIMTGGLAYTLWTAEGGDYHASTTGSTAYFDDGTEDIEIDISHLVEEWVKGLSGGAKGNIYGVGIRMENESAFSSSYTKKFSARGSQYFYSRPTLEARWDSATKDDRGNFYYSSSLAPAADNLNDVYLYNYSRGRLVDIPGIGSGDNIYVNLYASASDVPSGSALTLCGGGGATGSWVSTGVYSAPLCITASSTPLTTLHDVWSNLAQTVEYHTGSITPNSLNSSEQNSVSQVVMNITNLRDTYHRNENARFRLYTRQKDWNPTIYTKAVSTPDIHIVESGSFKVIRLIDDLDVVSFGTGSDMHTQMSFDSSGSYFDVDMSMLEAGYGYGLKFAIYDGGAGAWNEYPDVFKFRVEE